MSRIINVDKFHSILFSNLYQKKARKYDYAYYNLLAGYFELCCAKFNKEEDLLDYKADLYDVDFYLSIESYGHENIISFNMGAVDPKYLNDNNYSLEVLDKAFNIFSQIYEINNTLDLRIFNKAKKRLLNYILDLKTEPDRIAYQTAYRKLFINTVKDNSILFLYEFVKKITPKRLWTFYKNLMKCNKMFYVVGNSNDYFKTNNEFTLIPNLNVNITNYKKDLGIIFEPKATKQAYVTIFYKTNYLYYDKETLAVSVINYILGDSSYSKLYSIVREKYGLAYSISSLNYNSSDLLAIVATINKNDLDKVLKAIEETFDSLFDNVDLNNVKQYFINLQKLEEDSIYHYYSKDFHKNYLPNAFDSKSRDEIVNSLTIDDLKRVVNGFKLNLIYVYGGDLNE